MAVVDDDDESGEVVSLFCRSIDCSIGLRGGGGGGGGDAGAGGTVGSGGNTMLVVAGCAAVECSST